jgi:hypothetical protein
VEQEGGSFFPNPTPDPKEAAPSCRAKLRFTDEDKATAAWMFGLIRQMNPEHKEPNLNAWANDIRLTRERDGRTDEQIRTLFSWVNADDFWKTNILSPDKLRKQWDQVTIKMRHGSNGKAPMRVGPSHRHPDDAVDRWGAKPK